MSRFSFFIAWRYIAGSSHEKNIASMVRISFFSIFIGSFSLALVMAIMNGFEKVTHEKMQGIHAQIIMRAFGNELNTQAMGPVLKQEFPEIEAWSPTTLHQSIIQASDTDSITNVIVLKAIDPQQEAQITQFDKKIIETIGGKKNLAAAVYNDAIAVGDKLAKNLGIKVGDRINLLFSQDEKNRGRKITLGQTKAIIGGIFSTGIDEFDAGLALCSIPFFNSLFPEIGITQINIKLKPHENEDYVIEKLRKRFNGLEIYSWKELYPALVSALKLEKYAMFLILALIILVASMNIISLLFMQITQKKGDIAILKAMGASDNSLQSLFIYMGMTIAFTACCLGLFFACLASWFLETYPFITLPDAYYVTHLPARMEWQLLVIVFGVIMLISFFAAWIPVRRTRSINIAHVLRFEA